MNILLSNDDGIYAEGLNLLAETLSDLADITIVAPDRDRSGASNSLTLDTPVRVQRIKENRVSVQGTPTDSVHMAVTGLFTKTFDMVIAGINAGANLGDDILYSGTVAAATEGRHLGLPAIAVSLVGDFAKHFETAAHVTKQLVEHIIASPLPQDTLLNVNVPDVPLDQLQGMAVTRLGSRHCAEPVIKMKDPRGREVYWVGPAGEEADAGEGTDFYAIKQNKVAITPLKIDFTNYQLKDQLQDWVNQMEGR